MVGQFFSTCIKGFVVTGLLAALAFALSWPRQAIGQELLASPSLTLEGPEQQTVYTVVRYFDEQRCVKTVTSRMAVGREPHNLEFGHAGLKILVVSPTSRPITISLLDGQELIKRQSTHGIGELTMSYGEIPPNDSFQPERVLLNDEERKLATRFLNQIAAADTRELVASSAAANIQWQTLNAYCQALNRFLGQLQPSSLELDGWLSWQGNYGARVLAGKIYFADGECHFTLVFIEDLLMDVQVDCPSMAEDWFEGPSSEDEYIQTARRLADLLFQAAQRDMAEQAQQPFAPRYYQDVTVDGLQQMAKSLVEAYGPIPQSVRYLDSDMEAYQPEKDVRALRIFHVIEFPGNKQCISEATFEFSSQQNLIGRGDLAAIYVRESWTSAHPVAAQNGELFLRSYGDGKLALQCFHPSARSLIDEAELEQSLGKLRQRIGGLKGQPLLMRWQAQEVGNNLVAQGVVDFENGIYSLRMDFSEGLLIAVTLNGPSLAWHTASHVRETTALNQTAEGFWLSLLQGRIADAHAFLAAEFRQQLPQEQFQKLVSQSGFALEQQAPQILTDHILLSTRLDRPFPVMLAVYQTARLSSGEQQPLRCEFQQAQTGEWQLMNFNSDFQAVFPSHQWHEPFALLIDALRTANYEEFSSLFSAPLTETIEPEIAKAFLQKAQAAWAPIVDAAAREAGNDWRIRQIHEYDVGQHYEHLSTELISSSGQPVPLNATFRFDRLTSFRLDSPELNSFVELVNDKSCFDRHAIRVVDEWMAGNPQLLALLATELRDQKMQNQLSSLKARLIITHGDYISAKMSSRMLESAENRVICWLVLRFSGGQVPLKITLEVDALTSRVAGLECPEPTGSVEMPTP